MYKPDGTLSGMTHLNTPFSPPCPYSLRFIEVSEVEKVVGDVVYDVKIRFHRFKCICEANVRFVFIFIKLLSLKITNKMISP